MSFIRKIKPVKSDEIMGFNFPARELETYPALCEHLAMTKYDDGSPRKTSSFSVFVEGGQLKVAVNDKDNGRVAFSSMDSLEELLHHVEVLLSTDEADWRRAWTPKGKGK